MTDCLQQKTTSFSLTTDNYQNYTVCSNFVGQPLSREEASQKLNRSLLFQKAATDFSSDGDIVQRAIQLDYGMRLRSCVLSSSSLSLPNNNNNRLITRSSQRE